ncbi:Sodium-dependent glucose transporter 1 [Manis javanica]|nr:Sodium-dependent glucose transporter 1 [Manis javanica]
MTDLGRANDLIDSWQPLPEQRLLKAEAPAEEARAAGSRRGGGAGGALRGLVTAVLCAAFLGLGMSIAILGPTFQDLATNVNHNISSLSLIFVGRAFGYLSGSVIGGILFDSMNHFLLLGVSMFATTVGLYLVPLCKTAMLLVVMMSIFGVSVGVLDTGGNVLILAIWGDRGAPPMQALHFSFALGAFVAPLLAKLALGTAASAENGTAADSGRSALKQSSGAGSGRLLGIPDDMNLLWAYAVIGTYIFVVSILFFALFLKKSSWHEKAKISAQRSRRAEFHKPLLCLLFLFFFFYVGAEVTYGSYIFSFATAHAGMKESEAAGLNSVFWGTFAACRGLAIFFATCLQPGTMVVSSNIGSLGSSLFLVLFDKSPLCLWIASSVYGASMATTFPSGISWIEQYTTIHGKSAAFFVVGAALGEMAIPAVIGILQGSYPGLPVVGAQAAAARRCCYQRGLKSETVRFLAGGWTIKIPRPATGSFRLAPSAHTYKRRWSWSSGWTLSGSEAPLLYRRPRLGVAAWLRSSEPSLTLGPRVLASLPPVHGTAVAREAMQVSYQKSRWISLNGSLAADSKDSYQEAHPRGKANQRD